MATKSKTPPQPPPSFAVAPAQLLAETESLIGGTQALEDRLVENVTPASASFESVLRPLLRDDHAAARKLCVFRIFTSVAADPELRDAARKAEQMTAKAGAASLMRRDVAGLVASVYEKHRNGEVSLDDESAYKLFKTHRAYQNAGAGITDDARRAEYLAAVEERNAVLVAARKTLSETDDGVWFTRTQLAGVPTSKLDTMEASEDGNSLKVTFKRGHLQPVMKHATSARTRKALHVARENRFPENVEALERAVTLRDSIARMLGFANHAELRIEAKMAPSVESVVGRLHKLRDELKPLAQDEMEVLHALKKTYIEEHSSKVDEDNDDLATLNSWDWAFYARILEQQRYSVDSQRVSEYFEVRHSLDGMLRIFEEIFGIVFVPTDAPTWHDDVTVYAAWDSEEQGRGFLGYLYLDLYARDGKYAGAHSSLVQPGFTNDDNTRHYPSSSLVCSLVRSSSSDKPTLLQHSELKTMFHELGHAIHKLVTRTAYSHGCARDFVEIPSILLENWIWVPSVLQRLGRHYSYLNESSAKEKSDDQPPETLPQDLAESIARTKHVGAAHAMLHQVFLALFDLTIHSAASHEAAQATDTTALWNTTKADVVGLRTTTGIGQASFAHPFRAYDASYFTYALSKVFATNLWVTCFKNNPMDPEVGLRYRRCVLEPGGGQPEALSLKNFLGRDPSDEAYYSEVSGTK
ncbi:hypothetical protein EDB81DRAFT_881049 [Dactylonectria macrodidyma]|uniref:Peptidase M3A/M3B catalytic domain-containing protein n=1 Tax=Dactylonectria macrodidyma TaxID=307937 RepID=A0A9P9FA24_9HYPO|nr:hypothetical protein EDB81DRAFT_881049 [Dactylonectria macrodidyma]